MQEKYLTLVVNNQRFRDVCYYTPTYGLDNDYPYWISETGILVYRGKRRKAYKRQRRDSEGKPVGNQRYYYNLRCEKAHHDFTRAQLVAEAFCPNAKHKWIVHHLDGDCSNDYYKNLIWLTAEEHVRCHALLRAGDMKAYWQLIEQIEQDNAETPIEDMLYF